MSLRRRNRGLETLYGFALSALALTISMELTDPSWAATSLAERLAAPVLLPILTLFGLAMSGWTLAALFGLVVYGTVVLLFLPGPWLRFALAAGFLAWQLLGGYWAGAIASV